MICMARRVMATLQKIHTNCRKATPVPYCRDDDHMRVAVPDEKVSWSMSWPQYDPDDFTMPHVLKGPVWADPNIRYGYSLPLILILPLRLKHELAIKNQKPVINLFPGSKIVN